MGRKAGVCEGDRVQLVSVLMITARQALEQIAKRKRATGLKLLYVSKLVQEQLGVRWGPGREKDHVPQRNGGRGGLEKRPASDTDRQAATSQPNDRQLRKVRKQTRGNGVRLSNQCPADYRESSHAPPSVWIQMRRPSVRTTMLPCKSVRSTCAFRSCSDRTTSALGW